jgi:hypothetical protein
MGFHCPTFGATSVIQEFGSQFECRTVEILVDSALTHHRNHQGIYCRTKQPGTLRFDHALAFASGAAGHKKPSVVTYE